jgi:hypothetical protein
MRRSTIIFLISLSLLVSGSAAILAHRFGWSQSPELTLCLGHTILAGGMFLLGVAVSLRWPPPKDGPLYDTPVPLLTDPPALTKPWVPALSSMAFPECADHCARFEASGAGQCGFACSKKFGAGGNPLTQAELDRLCC